MEEILMEDWNGQNKQNPARHLAEKNFAPNPKNLSFDR